jgi:hypothetical protein
MFLFHDILEVFKINLFTILNLKIFYTFPCIPSKNTYELPNNNMITNTKQLLPYQSF